MADVAGGGVGGPSGNSGPETSGQGGLEGANDGATTLSTNTLRAGTPVPVPGPTAPNMSANTEALAAQEKSTKAIEDALKEMTETSKDLGRTYQTLEGVLALMAKEIKSMNLDVDKGSRKWRDIDVSVTSVVRSVDDAEDSFRNILRLQRQLSHDPGFFNGKSIAEAKKFYADILKQSERIARTGLGKNGMQELKVVTDRAREAMILLERAKGQALNSKDAEKLSAMLAEVNEQIIDMSDNVRDVKFSVWGDGVKKVGRAFEDTFDKRFAHTAFGQMVMGKLGPGLDRIKGMAKLGAFGQKLQEIPRQQREESFSRLQRNLGPHHPIAQAIVHERTKAAEKKAGITPAQNAAAVKPAVVTPSIAKTIATATGDTIAKVTRGRNERGQWLPKSVEAKMAMAPTTSTVGAAAVNAGEAAHAAGGSWLQRKAMDLATKHATKLLGNEAAGGIEGVLGKGAMKLLSAGGGSAATGAGAISGGAMMEGVGSVLSKANPIMAAIGAVIAARDMVVHENKEMLDTLGGAGLNAGGVNFTGARRTLMSTGTVDKTLYGMGTYKQNLEMMGALGQHGYSVADIASENDKQRPDLGKAMESGTGGFYGSLMKNVQYYGANVGMNTQQSTTLTMELMDKYRVTMGKTSEFFLQIDASQRTAGLSAGKYVQIVEEINGQFDEFNRGLRTTTALLNVLGRSGRLTGDQLKDMVKNMTANPQQNLAQRIVSAQGMVASGGNTRMAKELEDNIQASIEDANDAVKEAAKNAGLETMAPTYNGKNQPDIERWLDANKDRMNPQDFKAASVAMQTATQKQFRLGVAADAFKGGNVGEIAGALDFAGQNPEINTALNKENLQTLLTHTGALKPGESLASFLANPDKMREAFKDKALVTTAMTQSGTLSGKSLDDVMKTAESLRQVQGEGAKKITDVGMRAINANPMAAPAALAAGMSKNEVAAMAEAAKSLGLAKGGEGNNAAAEKLLTVLKEDPTGKKTNDLLMASQDFQNKLLSSSGATVKLMSETQKAEEARDKRKDIALKTRESADIFADAFAALFMKLVDAISTLGKVFDYKMWGKYFGGGDELEKRQTTEAGNAATEMLPLITKLLDVAREKKDTEASGILQSFLGKATSGKMTVEDMRDFQKLVSQKYSKDLTAEETASLNTRLAKGEKVAGGGAATDIYVSAGTTADEHSVDAMTGNVRTKYSLAMPAGPLSAADLDRGKPSSVLADEQSNIIKSIVKDAVDSQKASIVNGTLQTTDETLIASLDANSHALNDRFKGAVQQSSNGATHIYTFPTVHLQEVKAAAAAKSGEAPGWVGNH